jgi:hypothetical protein
MTLLACLLCLFLACAIATPPTPVKPIVRQPTWAIGEEVTVTGFNSGCGAIDKNGDLVDDDSPDKAGLVVWMEPDQLPSIWCEFDDETTFDKKLEGTRGISVKGIYAGIIRGAPHLNNCKVVKLGQRHDKP